MGVVALPWRVTGLAAISMSDEITFMPGCQGNSNSSQYDLASGVSWRLILNRTIFELAINWNPIRTTQAQMSHLGGRAKLARDLCVISSHLTAELRSAEQVGHPPLRKQNLFHRVVSSRPRRDQRNIYWLEFKLGFVGIRSERRLGRLQPVLVVALGKIRFVVRAPRFVAHGRSLGNHAGKLQHVVE